MSESSSSQQHHLEAEAITLLPPAPFWCRLSAWVYDFLVATAISMLSTVVAVLFINLLLSFGLVQLGEHPDVGAYLNHSYIFRIYVLLSLLLFFGYFWRNGGQTIGMRAWRLQLLSQKGGKITWKQVAIRFFTSLAGIGIFWVLVDRKQKQSWQDIAAKTYMVRLTKEENRILYQSLKR